MDSFVGTVACVVFIIIVCLVFLKNARQQTVVKRETVEPPIERALNPLSEYCSEQSTGLTRMVSHLRAHASSYRVDHINTGEVLLPEIIQIIRGVVLPKDEIRHSDVDLLFRIARFAGSGDTPINNVGQARTFMEGYQPPRGNFWPFLKRLADEEDNDLKRVLKIYSDLAFQIAMHSGDSWERRKVGLSRVLAELAQFEPEVWASKKPSAKVTATDDTGDPRLALLKVKHGCSIDKLQRAFHEQAALWHPDKLAHLAPELRVHAEAHMRELNLAYESLRQELR